MKASITALFAVAARVSAQSASDYGVPACANDCFLKGISASTCGLTDFYCQCDAQRQQIQDTTLKCLCTSTCTTNELFQVYQASTKICQQALADHGETYSAPLPDFAGMCKASTGSASATGGSTGANATGTSAQGATVSQTSSSSSAQTSSAGAARGLLVPGTVAALGGLAMFAL